VPFPRTAGSRPTGATGPRARLRRFVDAPWFSRFVIAVIIANAIDLGVIAAVEPHAPASGVAGVVDVIAVAIFTAEMVLKLAAYGRDFFRDPWNLFDLLIVGVALVPATEIFSVLRALRILRALRLVSAVPSMRRVVSALLAAIPGLLSILGLVVLVLYTGAVIGVHLFSDVTEYFGSMSQALYTMFKLLTVEGWPDISDAVLDHHPSGWIFFVVYIVICAFIMLNLLIGVIVSTMERDLNADMWAEDQRLEEAQHEAVMAELRGLRAEVAELRDQAGNGADTAN
jgi:voltage-gated sodium channel